MNFTKEDMYWMLVDGLGYSEESVDLVKKVMGDSVDTYKRILSKTTDFKTFQELSDSCENEGSV